MREKNRIQPLNCEIDLNPYVLGIARIFDFAQLINQPGKMSAEQIDYEALKSDWEALGNDMWHAMEMVMEA